MENNDKDILDCCIACKNKIEEELYPGTHNSPTTELHKALDKIKLPKYYSDEIKYTSEKLVQFTILVNDKYDVLNLKGIIELDHVVGMFTLIDPKFLHSQDGLNFYKKVIRDIKINLINGNT